MHLDRAATRLADTLQQAPILVPRPHQLARLLPPGRVQDLAIRVAPVALALSAGVAARAAVDGGGTHPAVSCRAEQGYRPAERAGHSAPPLHPHDVHCVREP